jgi:hypothetical protein
MYNSGLEVLSWHLEILVGNCKERELQRTPCLLQGILQVGQHLLMLPAVVSFGVEG